MTRFSLLLLLWSAAAGAETQPLQAIIGAARTNPLALKDLVATNLPYLYTQGIALVWGEDFLFLAETPKRPTVSVDGLPPVEMTCVPGSHIWYRLTKLRAGVTHSYEFQAEGGTLFPRRDVAGYNC